MSAADLRRLLLLAALWGGSFLFIRVAAPVLGPIITAEARVLIAGIALAIYALLRRSQLELRARWRQYLTIGLLNSALPFALIAAAQLRLTASMAAILNATSPIFGALIAAVWLRDPLTLSNLIGMAIAVSGVIILVGWSPMALNQITLLSIGASLLASACYGLAGTYTRARVMGAPPLGMAVGSQWGASLLLAPLIPLVPIRSTPSIIVVVCVLLLALLSTALAYLLYFRLIVDVGPTKALTVTFLTPIFGVVWGALFLNETITITKLFACVVILLGTAFVTGAPLRLPWASPRSNQHDLR